VADAVIAPRLTSGRVLQPVQRRLASQRRAVASPGCELAGEHCQHRVVAQLVVVDHVLVSKRDVSERDVEDALADQGGEREEVWI
jgi:hypothetical protein